MSNFIVVLSLGGKRVEKCIRRMDDLNMAPINVPAAGGVVDDLKVLLDRLLNNKLDQFELLSQADRLSVELRQTTSFSKQKFVVQKAI